MQCAYFLWPMPANFFWKRERRPPRSSSCWLPPVQAGCDFGSISSCMVSPGLPQVVRVVNSVPSVITTLMEWYFGCVSAFIALLPRVLEIALFFVGSRWNCGLYNPATGLKQAKSGADCQAYLGRGIVPPARRRQAQSGI